MTAKPKKIMRKSPTQARARVTVDAILQAGARILTREGYDALTTNRIAEAAGISIGSFYQYFADKESVIAALSKRHLDDLEATFDQAEVLVGATSLADIVRALIDANIAAHLVDPLLHGALSDALPPQGKEDWRVTFDTRTKKRVHALLSAYARDLRVKNLDLATFIVMRSVEACVHDAYKHRRDDMLSGRLAEEVSALVLNYLVGPNMHTRPGKTRRLQISMSSRHSSSDSLPRDDNDC